jgi:hypothetical protein
MALDSGSATAQPQVFALGVRIVVPDKEVVMGMLRILGPNGDTRVSWSPNDADSVESVRRRFDEIIAEGYLVFELNEQTKEGEQVKTFDPTVRELRAFRPLAGG